MSIRSITKPSPRLAGRHLATLIALVSIPVLLLAGCQTATPLHEAQSPETIDSLAVYVEQPDGATELDGKTVSGTIAVSIEAEGWMRDVRFFLDGVRIATLTRAPFEIEVDTTTLADGPHAIGIEARMANGRVRVSQLVEFVVDNETASGEPTAPDDSTPPGDEPEPTEPTPTEPVPGTDLSLRGDPSFTRSSLSAAERDWHDALLARIANPASDFDPLAFARRDDVYHYGRTLHTYVQSILTAFRVTGDLRLLDHVDAIAEVMRGELRDGWRDTLDGTDGTRDGYLNWVFRYGNSTTYQGKDTHQINEMRTHSMIATIAYALELNRDLASPSGRNYGAHADFWTDYLVNHFEAKWRERRNKPTGFPIMIRPHTHTYYSWAKWHYYMGLLTGDAGYSAEADRMASVLQAELRAVATASGSAYVWPRSVLAEGGGDEFLHPTTYARYVYADIVEFHLEGFHFWSDPVVMERFARTMTDLVVDNPDPVRNDFAADIGGGESQAGFISDPNWSRLSVHRYALSSLAHIGPWDPTARLAGITADIHHLRNARDSDTTRLMTALLLDARLRGAIATAAAN